MNAVEHLPSRTMTAWRLTAKLLLVLGTALLVVWTSLHPSALTVWVLASPLLVIAFAQRKHLMISHTRADTWRAGLLAAAAVGAFVALVCASPFMMQHFEWLYFAQHLGVHAALAMVFGSTLMPHRTPLCTKLAAWVHDDVTEPSLWRYTRGVTVAWTIYFTVVCIASIALFVGAPFTSWTWFSTVGSLVGTAAMFAIENFARRFFLPAKDRIGLLRTIEAVSQQFSKP